MVISKLSRRNCQSPRRERERERREGIERMERRGRERGREERESLTSCLAGSGILSKVIIKDFPAVLHVTSTIYQTNHSHVLLTSNFVAKSSGLFRICKS